MNVKLVSVTQSMVQEKPLSPEDLIVYTARVSNPDNQLNTESSERLLNYLVKHKHWSPFEMVDMTVEITTSRAIAAQILRHRSFSFQEFSQRYSRTLNVEPVQLRKAAEKNRQSSEEEFDPGIYKMGDNDAGVSAKEIVEQTLVDLQALYCTLIEAGVAKECARMILPLTASTTIYMKGSVRSWIHYLQIRLEQNTQLEHRQVAEQIREIFNSVFPTISKAIEL